MTIIVFTEKNKAAETISKILNNGKTSRYSIERIPIYEFKKDGKDWKIMGLSGHITEYDYPKEYSNWRAIDPENLISVMPIKVVTKKQFELAITQISKSATKIILACDFDREGENIGFEAKTIAEKVSKASVKRAKFSSLSKSEITRAFDNLVEPDENMAMSAEVRQILDLKMGASFTRLLTLSVQKYARTKDIISIGPCQTPTCGFVYERECKIKEFKPSDFWKIEAILKKQTHKFSALHIAGNITKKEKADAIFKKVQNHKEAILTNKIVKEAKTQPPFPLNTTEFLKRASTYLKISSIKSLEIAEQLYLSGFISYPRTETNKYANDFDFKSYLSEFEKSTIKEYKEYATQILLNPIISRNGTKDGHDHPPIHPIKVTSKKEITRSVSTTGAWEVYDFVVRHFFANLMNPAIFEKVKLEISINNEIFISTGSTLKNAGWLTVYPFEKKNEKLLPVVEIGEILSIEKIKQIKSKTTAPKQLTEAELLTLMDKHGIGTKSTAPSHIETNKRRGYFETKGKTISILDTGFTLMDALNGSVSVLIKPEIRSKIESLIQEVEDGNKSFDDAIEEGTLLIKSMYKKILLGKNEIVSRIVGTVKIESIKIDKKNLIGTCKECGQTLHIIKTDTSRFVGCTGYPMCKNTYPLPKKNVIVVARSKVCKKEEGVAIIKVDNKYHWAIGVGPCFTCESEKICYPPKIVGNCIKCDGKMIMISLKSSRFLGCVNRCGYTHALPKNGRITILDRICDICGWHIIRVKEVNKDAIEYCSNMACRYKAMKS